MAIQQYNRVVDSDATVGRLYHHLSIVLRDNYLESFFNILKALTVSKPFCSAWETMVSTILAKFVAPEGQTSTELHETLSLDEDNLYTVISRLLLASAPPVDLQKSQFDTCKETHLFAFDALLRFVTEADSLPSSSMGPKSWDTNRPKWLFQSHTVRPRYVCIDVISYIWNRFILTCCSPELGLILCQLLFIHKDLAITDRAARLLSAVNLRILIRPVTHDLKLWQYLHVLLVVMRSLNTRTDLMERFGYAFHPELMAPLLNILLRRLMNRGGEAWKALFRPEFPVLWVPLNPKSKPEKYGMTTADAQREYFARKRKYEAGNSIADDTKTEALSTKAVNANIITTRDGTDKLETKVKSGNIKQGSFVLGTYDIGVNQRDDSKRKCNSTQPSLQANAGVADHEPEDSLAIAQGAAAYGVISENHIGFGGSAVEQLYTIILPEDRLLRGFSFANEAPCPPEPENPPSEKQIVRKKFEDEEIRIARLKEDKANQRAKRQEKRVNHKQQKRVARGVASQSQEPPKIKLDTVLEAVENRSMEDGAAASTDDTRNNTRQANKSTTDVFAESVQSVELISDVEDTAEAILKDATDVLSQKSEYPNAHANGSVIEDPPDLTVLFHVADEDAAQAVYITNPANADATTACEEAGKVNATEKSSHPTVIKPENDYGISDAVVQPDTEANNAEMKAQKTREKTQKQEDVLSLDPYFYPPRFFESSKLDWDDFLAYHDYVEDSEIMDNRELRVLWTASSKNRFFHLQMDENGDYIIGVPGGKPVPLPYFDARMPALITRSNGSQVIYVDPTVEKMDAEQDWLPCTPVQGGESVQGFDTDNSVEMDARQAENALQKVEKTRLDLKTTEEVKPVQNVEALGEWCTVLGESSMGAANETGSATITQESSDKALNIPGPGAGVARSAHAIVAAVPTQGEEDLKTAVMKHQPSKSTEEWVQAQGADEDETTERVDEDDENSDGWTELN